MQCEQYFYCEQYIYQVYRQNNLIYFCSIFEYLKNLNEEPSYPSVKIEYLRCVIESRSMRFGLNSPLKFTFASFTCRSEENLVKQLEKVQFDASETKDRLQRRIVVIFVTQSFFIKQYYYYISTAHFARLYMGCFILIL